MIRGVGEIAIQFDSFRNVDLFHQGIYCLQARVFREFQEGGRRVYAMPFQTPKHSNSPDAAKAASLPQGEGMDRGMDSADI